jgi:hypothetical protein
METLQEVLAWVWARHHNELSWYVRPLFILPFCYFAYRRSIRGILLTLLLLPTSLFWFPAPAQPSPRVIEYLAWEREFVTGDNLVAKLVLLVLVIGFFVALAAAFWKRNWLYGLGVLNAATLLKVIWSVAFGGAIGWAALLPSLVTLVICNTIIVLAMRWRDKRGIRRVLA